MTVIQTQRVRSRADLHGRRLAMSRYPARRPNGSPIDMLALAQRVAATNTIVPVGDIEVVDAEPVLDARGRHRSPANRPGAHRGVAPANKGLRYPPDPPTVTECMAMLRACPPTPYGRRLYAAIMFMWQGALRAFEALAVTEADLDDESGRIQIRHGKGDKQAMIRMAQWAWPFLDEWRAIRRELPNPRGPLLCVIDPPTGGRAWSYPDMRRRLKDLATEAGIAKRVAPHQLRHGFAVQAYEAGVPLRAIQLHLRHENIGITDTYLQGMGADESLERVYQQAMPTVPATALLELTGGFGAR
jgi:integrase